MLVVKTTLQPTADKGIGLFADQPIKKGQPVWTYDPLIDITISKHDIPAQATEFFDTYAVDQGGETVLLSIDNARFINHSSNPNIKSLGHHKDNIATRDIATGEEITIDYATIDVNRLGF